MSKLSELKDRTKNLDILYVEDDPASRQQISSIMEMLFASLTVGEDGMEGLELYKNSKFDLVITDINMPNMNGIEMMKQIKAINPMQKVIIVSAHDSGEYLLSAIRAGVDNFILKPVEMEQFQEVISKVATIIHNEKLQEHYRQELEAEVTEKTVELLQQAITDDLTGLYNRKKLNMCLEKPGKKILMMLDVDNYDNINVTYGYNNGDIILQKIAQFLKENLLDDSVLFRLGHDEFVFLFEHNTIEEIELYAKEIQELISRKPIEYEETQVRFTATIVLAEGDKDLLKDVHLAFKRTRTIGKNRIGIYYPDIELEQHQKYIQKCIYMLSDAIKKQHVVPYFQPIVNNKTNEIEKYECLARIVNESGVKTPVQFIEAAELSGMLPDITRIMIEKSFDFFKDKSEEFSINISEIDLNNNYLVDFLKEQALKFKISPQRVVLEVLEGISASGAQKSVEQLMALKEYGFQLAIDDFGAQNSNFERVHKLKVDYIKIDGSFIKRIDNDSNSFHIAKTIADFSKSIGAKVIAEYVHSEEVYNKVLELGIDYSQGYYFSEPIPEIQG